MIDVCALRRAGTRAGSGRRRAAATVALLLTASLAVAGCGASSGGDRSASKAAAPPRAAAPGNAGGGSGPGGAPATGTGGTPAAGDSSASSGGGKTPAPATYLVRTATLSVSTPHVEAQLDKARQYADQAGGYTGDEDTAVDARGRVTSSIQLRVPPARYDETLTELAGLGRLLSREVNVEDVTGQVVDVQSRIASQRASVSRVRALMNRASSLTDVVSLESELSTREAALEALEAQQASLRSRTDLATITLRLSEPPARVAAAPKPEHKERGFWGAVGHALGEGWHAFYLTVRVLLVVLALVLPFLALAGLAYLAYRRFVPRGTK